MYGIAYVEADSLDEAIRKVEADDFPLPDGDYVTASFMVDHESTDNLDNPQEWGWDTASEKLTRFK